MIDQTVECNLCGCHDVSIVEDDNIVMQVLKCRRCSLVFLHPHPDIEAAAQHYDADYYSEWIDIQKKKRITMWKERLQRVKRFRQGGELLDIGCGEGTFLKLARDSGWNIEGTELSVYGSQYASRILQTHIFCGELPEAGYKDNSFDVVTMWHVLEHVRDPLGYLFEIYRILKPQGLLVVAVPNVNNVFMQIAYRIIKGRKLKLYSSGEKELHLYHFSPQSLQSYLDKTGFECLSLSPDYGIIELPKKIVNMISVVPYYCFGIHGYNAIEIFAVSRKG